MNLATINDAGGQPAAVESAVACEAGGCESYVGTHAANATAVVAGGVAGNHAIGDGERTTIPGGVIGNTAAPARS